jgi:hypothetical protein
MAKELKFPTATLYELSEELKLLMDDLEDWAEQNAGDISEYPMERLEKLEGDVKDKALKIAALYKDLKANEEMLAEEAKALAARKKAHGNKKDRLKKYLESCLPANAKWENARAAIAWKKNPPAVEVLVPADQLPTKYQVVTREVSKAELKLDMVPYTVPELDGLGGPVFDTDGKAVTREELQVRWPMPTGEKKTVAGDEEGGEPIEVDVFEDRVIARMVQGKGITIK